jgi:hypothetical protein
MPCRRPIPTDVAAFTPTTDNAPAVAQTERGFSYFNRLEPYSLIQQFIAHPPAQFVPMLAPEGIPVFSTCFDLLTTLDKEARRRVMALPLYGRWKRLLQPRTCFVGTTVTEYAWFPLHVSPAGLVAGLKLRYATKYPFLIIKDIPQSSPLLDSASNAHARDVLAACRTAGFILVEGQALAFVPIDFDSVDDYVSRMSPARRKDIRRKLRAKHDLDIVALNGGNTRFDSPELLVEYYALYLNVFGQSEIHFDILSADFFRDILRDSSSGAIIFEYRHAGRLIGFNLCFETGGKLVDKYVGFRYPEARNFNLYFVSWFHNLGYALERGLTHYVAGWTDPQIKAYLGAQFTFTRHAVHVRNGFLRAVLRRCARWFESDLKWHRGHTDAGSGHP